MPDPRLIEDAAERDELGMMPGVEMQSPYSIRWDPRRGISNDEFMDFGWIGEDASGIWMTIHPEIALIDDPDLWSIVAQFRLSSQHDVMADNYETKSNWWLNAWAAMQGAAIRSRIKSAEETRK